MMGKTRKIHKRNVLLVTGVFPPGIGGMQSYYYHLSRTTSHRMSVLAPIYGAEDHKVDHGQPYTINRERFLQNESINPASWPRLLYYTLKSIRTQHTDVTIYGYILLGLIGMLLKLFFKKKYVVSVHGKDLLEFGHIPGLHALSKLILRRADGVLANSMYTKQISMDYGVEEHKIQIVYPGVEASFERGAPDSELVARHGLAGKFVLLTVGRLVKRKGQDMVIRSLPALIKRIPNLKYVIVGDGPERKALQQEADRAGVGEHLVFAGYVNESSELEKYYRSADVFIMTSRFLADKGDVEGFGIVYLEAASCGLPAIAGRTGGVGEAVVDKVTGLLIDPTKTEPIIAAVLQLHEQPALRSSLAEAAYQRAKSQFQYESIIGKMDRFLNTVCAGEASPIGEESRASS